MFYVSMVIQLRGRHRSSVCCDVSCELMKELYGTELKKYESGTLDEV